MYVVRSFERGLHTVGHEDQAGTFHPSSDHQDRREAEDRAAYLNGGPGPVDTESTVSTPKLEIHYEEEWAALYMDGRLECVGDSSHPEARALEILGVTTVLDDAFMRGQKQESGVARSLEEVAEYRIQRDGRRAETDRLREEARRILERADALDGQNG